MILETRDWKWFHWTFLMCCWSVSQCSDGPENLKSLRTSEFMEESEVKENGQHQPSVISLQSLFPIPLNSSDCSNYLNNVLINTTNEAVITSPGASLQIEKVNDGGEHFQVINNLGNLCLPTFIKKRYIDIMKSKLYSLDVTKGSNITSGALDSCFNVIHDSNILLWHDFLSFDGDHMWFIWFPYTKTCFANKCSITERLFSECNKEIDKFQAVLSKDSPNKSPEVSAEDIKFSLMPTIRWSCPLSNHGSLNEAISLSRLWLHNRVLPKFCAMLLCNSKTYSLVDLNVFVIATNRSDQYRECRQYSSRNSSFTDDMQIFSFEVPPKKKILFLVGENKYMDAEYARFLTLFHYAHNMQFRQCCHHLPDYQLHSDGKKFYLFCYGTSFSCRSTNDFWFTEEVFENNHITIMSENIVQSKAIQWLVTLNIQISSPLYDHISSLEYNYTTFAKFKILSFKLNTHDKKKLKIIISELEDKNVNCNETEYVTVCYKYSTYLMFLYNCSLGHPKDDKDLLLLVNPFLETGLTTEYLCQRNISVVLGSAQLTRFSKNRSTSDPNTIFRPCLNLGIGMVGNNVMEHMCDNEIKYAEQQRYGLDFYWNELNQFLIFPLQINTESATEQFTLERNVIPNSTLDVMPKEGPFRGHHFRISQSKVNPITLPIMQSIEGNPNAKILSMQQTLKIFMIARLTNNTQCLQDLFGQRFSIHVGVSEQLQYLMGPISMDVIISPCLTILPDDIFDGLHQSFKRKMITINKFWPTCFYNMLVSWKGEKDMVIDWDYQPSECKVKEIALLCVSTIITLVAIVGNVLVLIILFASGLAKNGAFIIYTSMAVADLLLGIMPGLLALIDHISLMNGLLTLSHLDDDGAFAEFYHLTTQQSPGFQQLRFERHGYPMICSMMLNVSVYVSLLSLTLLSIERLQALRGNLIRQHRIKLFIGLTWFLGISFSLLVNWREKGWLFAGYFDPITKLTKNIGSGDVSVSSVFFYLQVATGGTAGLTAVILTMASIIHHCYVKYQKSRGEAIHEQFGTGKRMDLTLMYTVTVFVVASCPLLVDILADLANENPVLHFFAWWLFMAGTSWKFALYAFREENFRKEAKQIFSWLRSRVKSMPLESQWSLEMK